MTSSLNGINVTQARVDIPSWGVWHAEATLDEEAELSGEVTLKIRDLTLTGTVMSGGSSQGRSHWRIAAGAGGWGREIAAAAYANDAGVKYSTILEDAARAAGETIEATTLPTTKAPGAFVRERAPAARVLQLLVPEGWYVDENGVTRIGQRASAALSVDAERGPMDRARGTVTIATEQIATVLPGVIVDGLQAVDVRHEVTSSGLRSTLWGAGIAPTSRRLASLKRLILSLLPDYRYRGAYEYRVVTIEGARLNLQPVRVSSRMPDLRRVPVRPGVAGCTAEVALGSRVLVTFVDADPARPVVISHEDEDGDGFAPVSLTLVGEDDAALDVADPTRRVVRYGDQVSIPVVGAAAVGVVAKDLAATSFSRVRA